jgi:hypothetical protein
MKAWQISESDLATVLAEVNRQYDGNIRLEEVRTEGKRVRTVSFILRTHDPRGMGSRRGPLRRTTSSMAALVHA